MAIRNVTDIYAVKQLKYYSGKNKRNIREDEQPK